VRREQAEWYAAQIRPPAIATVDRVRAPARLPQVDSLSPPEELAAEAPRTGSDRSASGSTRLFTVVSGDEMVSRDGSPQPAPSRLPPLPHAAKVTFTTIDGAGEAQDSHDVLTDGFSVAEEPTMYEYAGRVAPAAPLAGKFAGAGDELFDSPTYEHAPRVTVMAGDGGGGLSAELGTQESPVAPIAMLLPTPPSTPALGPFGTVSPRMTRLAAEIEAMEASPGRVCH
jgi:hypothetical protein